MFTKKFWIDTVERVLSTAAQAAVAAWGLDQMSAFDADWKYIGGLALSAGFLALLKALYARTNGDPEKASLVQ